MCDRVDPTPVPTTETYRAGVSRFVGDWTVREAHLGRPASKTAFRCSSARFGAAQLLHVQARTGVHVQQLRADVVQRDYSNNVALAAFGTPADLPLVWVQTGSFHPESVERFDGVRTEMDIGKFEEFQRIPPERCFDQEGERWWVDAGNGDRARYNFSGAWLRPIGRPNGEIIYDLAGTVPPIREYMDGDRTVRAVEVRMRFRSYVYRRPTPALPVARQEPLAVVYWREYRRFHRGDPDAEVREDEARVRVPLIWPNPVTPPGYRSRLWTAFRRP